MIRWFLYSTAGVGSSRLASSSHDQVTWTEVGAPAGSGEFFWGFLQILILIRDVSVDDSTVISVDDDTVIYVYDTLFIIFIASTFSWWKASSAPRK